MRISKKKVVHYLESVIKQQSPLIEELKNEVKQNNNGTSNNKSPQELSKDMKGEKK